MSPKLQITKIHKRIKTKVEDFVNFCALVFSPTLQYLWHWQACSWFKKILLIKVSFIFLSKKIILVTIVLFFSISIQSFSQEPEPKVKQDVSDITDKIENVAQSTDEILDYSDLIQDIKYYQENPLNLNYASTTDLEKLFFLNEMQIFNLIAYRESYGYFLTLFELQSIEGFDTETIQKILPYIMVSEKKPALGFNLKDLTKYGRHEVIMRYQRVLQEQEGYAPISDSALYASPNSRYLGSPDKIYLKYSFNFRDRVKLGFLTEKDAGEPFLISQVNDSIQTLTGNQLKNGFDFYSFNFSLQDFGILKVFTVGDYQLSFGQGLTLSSGLAFGKSSEAVDVKRTARGLRSSVSSNENLFFRGSSATIAYNQFDLTAFYSNHSVDANLSEGDSLTSETAYISSMQESGLHRTPGELQDKKAVNIRAFGGHLSWRLSRLKLGVTSYYSKLGNQLYQDSDLYKKFNFEGSENFNAGFDYNWLFRKLNFYGEISYSQSGAIAQLHGITASPHPSLALTVLYRNYAKDYQNFYSNAFAEGSSNYNEQGLFTGIKVQLIHKWMLTGYFDNFRFPWLKYRVDAPSSGNETMIKIQKILGYDVLMYFSFRQSNRQLNEPAGEQITTALVNTRRNNYRFHIEYSISPAITLKNRFEYSFYKEGTTYKGTGYLIYQDVAWKNAAGKLSLTARYALFDTDSWDERIYAYENDLLYAFSVPAYYYKGSRCYLLFGYRVTQAINLSIRFAYSSMSNRSVFGSGLDEIDGNHKSELKVQLRINL